MATKTSGIMEKTDFIVIRRFDSLGEAQIIKSLLESAGFKCYLSNEYISSILPLGSASDSFSYGLCVRAGDEASALAFLKAKPEKEKAEK